MKSAYCVLLNLVFLLNLGLLRVLAQSQSVSFSVRHEHRLGQCNGTLRIEGKGVTFETSHRKHARVWSFSDIRQLEILSRTRLAVHIYGKPETFNFGLREGELTVDTYRLLSDRIERGVTSRVLFLGTEFAFELPAKHRHRLGGCEGVLRIAGIEIIYTTENAKDTRIWRIRDIRSFGTMAPYDLRLSTEKETFTFDLKEPLSQKLYDDLWQKIYGPQFAPVHRPP